MRLAGYPHDDGALLHGFGGIFDLEDTTLRRAVDLSVRFLQQGRAGVIQCHRIVVIIVSEHLECSVVR